MKILIKIWAITILTLMSVQFFSLPVTVYLYQNHNETLTASCCVNVNTDPSCKAKCVLEDTKDEQKETSELLKKETSLLFYQEIKIASNKPGFLEKVKEQSFYINQYSFSFQETHLKPPQIINS